MKNKTFLIKADNDKEAVMRLPVNRYGGITNKGFEMVSQRFYDGSTNKGGSLKYALNLEVYSSGKSLKEAIERYLKNIL